MQTSEAYFAALQRLIRPVRAIQYPQSLSSMHALLRAMGSPHKRLRSVVIGGSVGKGTTATFLAQLLRAEATRVGCYRGPHLHSWRERFALDGGWISAEEFTAGAERVLLAASRAGVEGSTFELNTALALFWFAEKDVDWAVLEVGIGGRWDAVNAAEHELAILTPIEREHRNLLGGSLSSIARHKAGLMPEQGRVISAAQSPMVTQILQQQAERKGAQLTFLGRRVVEPFAVAQQLAVAAFRSLRPSETVPGIALIPPPGRYERWQDQGRSWLLDGGHTARAGQQLAKFLRRQNAGAQPNLIVLAMLRDKAVRAFVEPLDSPKNEFWFTTVPGQRALSAEELRQRSGLQRANARLIPTAEEASRRAQVSDHRHIVVTGSLRLVAIAREEIGLVSAAIREEARRTRTIITAQWKPTEPRAILRDPSPRSSGERAEVS